MNTNTVDGEKIIGAESGAVAQLITRVDGENVEVAYFTDTQFVLGEIITFQESNIETTVQAITLGNNSIPNSNNACGLPSHPYLGGTTVTTKMKTIVLMPIMLLLRSV